jgi:lactate permease
LSLFAIVLRRKQNGTLPDMTALARDLAPYAAILALVLATRLIGPVQETLSAHCAVVVAGDRFSGSFAPLYHPGTLLFAGLALGALATGRSAAIAPAITGALGRIVPVALALLAMLALSRVMVHGGLISTLAEAAATTGALWPLLRAAHRGPRHLRHRLRHRVQHPVHRVPDRRRRHAGLSARGAGRRPGLRLGHRQHRGPP